jgi:hypothetical protein
MGYQRKLQELMLYQLINENIISFGKAAEIIGKDKISLIIDSGEMGTPYYDCDIDEVVEDAKCAFKRNIALYKSNNI